MEIDYLIVGAGIVGTSVALQIAKKEPTARITLIDKEPAIGMHASGRNSGVLHAGFYYTANSLKARFCRLGNQALRQWCLEHKLPINQCGKLVVARNEEELQGLDILLQRAHVNDVELHKITAAEAKVIEPRVKTYKYALWSPTTATVAPLDVLTSFLAHAKKLKIDVRLGVGYKRHVDKRVELTSGEWIKPTFLINCAGLYADAIAREYGFGARYTILPFKGVYLYSSEPVGALRTNIYPVPNLANPFLGVHHTVTVDGHSKIGPTAMPAFWREQYKGFDRFRFAEFFQIIKEQLQLFVGGGFDFRALAFEEMKKYSRSYLVKQSAELLEGVRLENYTHWGKAGIRAQLLDIHERKLVNDFCFEGDAHSLHVLNAVSPAFTSAIPFAEHLYKEIMRLRVSNTADR